MIITCLPGDGIGPEITDAVLSIINELHLDLEFEKYEVGEKAYEKYGVLIPDEVKESIYRNKIVLKAPITTPVGKGFRSINVQLRLLLDIYANIRPAKSLPHVYSRYNDIDLVVFRENTEDLYIGEETVIKENEEIHAIKKITRMASERIIRAAFEYAVKNGRKKVTCVHKANILKKSDGLFLGIFREIAPEYPGIEATDCIIDNCCMQLVMRPEQFDVMVMPNLYGDILSDLTSGLIGGLGLLPSMNLGKEYAVFEAVHGTAPDIAGQNIANPTAMLLSACLMLEHIGFENESARVKNALYKVLENKEHCTRDIGGEASTREFADYIIEELNKQ